MYWMVAQDSLHPISRWLSQRWCANITFARVLQRSWWPFTLCASRWSWPRVWRHTPRRRIHQRMVWRYLGWRRVSIARRCIWGHVGRQRGKWFVEQHGSGIRRWLLSSRRVLGGLLPTSVRQRLIALHAEYALRRPCILQVIDLAFAIPTPEAARTEGLVTGEDGEVFDLVPTGAAAVRAVVADKGAIAKK